MSVYELAMVHWPEHFHEEIIGILTGLELDEILPITSGISIWRGTQYRDTFRKLGFNCNNRFIKFDKKTEYPCMMRCTKRGDKEHWYSWVYYNGFVYLPLTSGEETVAGKVTWAYWNECFPQFRVTSMLQVWI